MGTRTSAPRKEIHLRDYLMVLDRYKWFIVAAVMVTMSSTVLYLRRQEPIYEAKTRIIIEPKRGQEMIFQAAVQAISLDLETQLEVIKTTPVLSLVVRAVGLTTEPEGTLEFSQVVKNLRKSVGIGFVGNTKMVTISAKHTVPETARDIANAIAQAYIDQDRLSRLEAGRDAVRWLSVQLADLKTKLKNSEEDFQKFKEAEGILTLDDKRSAELAEISKLHSGYLTARTNRTEIEAIIDKIKSQESEIENMNIPIALLNTPSLQKLGTELSQLQTDLANKRTLFKETYPGVVELKERVDFTEQKILAELKRQRDFLKVQEESFTRQQEAKRTEALNLTKKELDYLTLEREVTTNREMYNTLVSKVKELSLAGKSDLNNIRIVEPAELPGEPAGNDKLTLALGGFMGLFMGVGFAFFLKYLENTIRTPEDVEDHLELPVLGVIPQVAEAKNSKQPILILKGNPKSAAAEAYRSLRTNILFSGLKTSSANSGADPLPHPKTIVITSAGPGEGKSFTAANLGMAMAQAGQKALLIDADLRRPMIHKVFGVSRAIGLSTVLAGEATLEEAVAETDVPNLSVLTSGKVPDNPTEVLGSPQMAELLQTVKEQYDMVLLDSAPVLGMADTVVLASEADAVAIVIKTGAAIRKALKLAMAQLERVDAQICGVVLNDVDIRRDRYYDYYYYYYYSPYEDDAERMIRKRGKRRSSSGTETTAESQSATGS